MENLDANLIKEQAEGTELSRTYNLELANGPEALSVVENLNTLYDTILGNQQITSESLDSLRQSLGHMKFNFGGEEVSLAELRSSPENISLIKAYNVCRGEFPISELKKIPGLGGNLKILEEIEAGKCDTGLTFNLNLLPRHLAQPLMACRGELDLELSNLFVVSDETIEIISHHDGVILLPRLKEISDNMARSFSRHKKQLTLGVTELSDGAAAGLGQHHGSLLLLGLNKISEQGALALAEHEGYLWIRELKDLSDEVIKKLVQVGNKYTEGGIEFGLTSLSDAAAKALSQYKFRLSFDHLETISDRAVKYLSKHQGGSLSLNALKAVSDWQAKRLVKYKGGLGLMAAELSDYALDLFAHRKEIYVLSDYDRKFRELKRKYGTNEWRYP